MESRAVKRAEAILIAAARTNRLANKYRTGTGAIASPNKPRLLRRL